jgi:hypothetical protein
LVVAGGILLWENVTKMLLSSETKRALYGGAFLAVTFLNWRKENRRADAAQRELVSQTEMDEIHDLVRELVAASFPTVAINTIRLDFVLSDGFIASTQGNRIRLSIGDVCRMSTPALTGLLVHELCHMESNSRLSPFAKVISSIRRPRSEESRTRVERETDQAAIAKGYGAELLALLEYHDESYEDYDSADGLTQEEVRAALAQQSERSISQ